MLQRKKAGQPPPVPEEAKQVFECTERAGAAFHKVASALLADFGNRGRLFAALYGDYAPETHARLDTIDPADIAAAGAHKTKLHSRVTCNRILQAQLSQPHSHIAWQSWRQEKVPRCAKYAQATP